MEKVRGVKDLGVFHSLGQPNIKITPDRRACARYGLNTGDLEAVIQAAIGGQAVTQVYEGEKMFDLAVRWQPEYRQSLEAISEITVATPDGNNIPLGQLANIQEVDGPRHRLPRGRLPLRAGEVLGARPRPRRHHRRGAAEDRQEGQAAPTTPTSSGRARCSELEAAMGRLAFILPLTLLLISFLVYTAVKNWIDTLIVIVDIPVACTGGVLALLIARINFSVSAAMGFVSVFGIAVQDALLMVSYFQQLRGRGHGDREVGARGRRRSASGPC